MMTWYFIKEQVWGCVEPILFGPYETEEERDKAYNELIEECGDPSESEHCYIKLKGKWIEIE